MPPRGRRVRREAAPRPYEARAPDDDYHADNVCIDLDDFGWVVESGIHTFFGKDYGIEYVRAPPRHARLPSEGGAAASGAPCAYRAC